MLLVITTDGYGKRVSLSDIRSCKRNTQGRMLSSAPVAAALTLTDDDGDIVIATANGMVERVAISSVPIRRRVVVSKGKLAKGVPIIRLSDGDRVTGAALCPPDQAATRLIPAPKTTEAVEWVWDRAGLLEGERIVSADTLSLPTPLEQIVTGGRPAIARDEWAKTDVHAVSSYSCAHCGRDYEHPEEVYECIDAHATAAQCLGQVAA